MNRTLDDRFLCECDTHGVYRIFDVLVCNIESPANGSFATPVALKKRSMIRGLGVEFMALPKKTRQSPSPRMPDHHLRTGPAA